MSKLLYIVFVLIIIKYVVRYVFDREYFTSMSQLAYDLNRPSKEYSSGFSLNNHNFFNRDTRAYDRLRKEYNFQNDVNSFDDYVKGKNFYDNSSSSLSEYYRMMYDGNFYKYSNNDTRNHINYHRNSIIGNNDRYSTSSNMIKLSGQKNKELNRKLAENQKREIEKSINKYREAQKYI